MFFARLRARSRANPDAGFSLIEVLVAIGIFGIVATFVANSLAAGMRGALLGKRREVATQEASRILEIARSLTYDELGLAQSDSTLGTDASILDIAGAKKYAVGGGSFEPIVYSVNPTGHPFNPHQASISRAATNLTHYVYVTGHDADIDGVMDFKRVVVRVTWDSAGTPGPANEVRVQTFAHPGGFVTSAEGGAGPDGTSGTTPMTASASAEALTASIFSARGSLDPATDAVLPEDPVMVTGPKTSGATSFRAVSSVGCTAQTASLQGSSSSYGQHSVAASADDDSLTATSSGPPDQTWSGVPVDTVGAGDDVDRLFVQPTLSSTSSCHADTDDTDGNTPDDDGLPYGNGDAGVSASVQLAEDATGAGLPSAAVTVLDTPAQTASQGIDHVIVAGVRETAATTSYQTTGITRVLVVPDVIPDGLVRIDSLSVTASMSASPLTPSAIPSLTFPGGLSIWIFDPSAELSGCSERSGQYCRITLAPDSGTFTGTSIEVGGSVTSGQATLEYALSVESMAPMVGIAAGDDGANGERRWRAAFVPLSVSASLIVRVPVEGGGSVQLTSSKVDLGLGNIAVDGCAGVACG